MICSVTYATIGAGLLVSSPVILANTTSEVASPIVSQISGMQRTPEAMASMKAPKLTEPEWLTRQKAAEKAAANQVTARPSAGKRVVTYDIMTRGTITSDLAEFRAQSNATLNDSRGWSQMGVSFQEVSSGGMFTLVLSEANQVTSFSSGCGAEYSCRVGRFVIINQDRWQTATPSWNSAGGSLRDYRHMVVNHETGHWLGHGHANCSGAGQLAPVMQQQSMNLQGCDFNAWPTTSELYSSQLGIR